MGVNTISVYDGVTTLNLNDGTACFITSYPMQSPVVDQAVIAGAQDGMNLSTPTWGNVEESMELMVIGATVGAVRATINSLEAIIDRARQNRLTWGNARCFLQAQIDGESSVWRSEILAGRVTVQEPLDGTWKMKMRVTLQLTRRYYWEGPRTAVYMNSSATAETTDPVAWTQGSDGTNYLKIAAARVTGVLPAPLELRLTFGGTTSAVRDVYIGNFVWMDPANIDPILQGAAAAEGADHTWATDPETTTHTFTLANALLADINGQYVRPLVAFSEVPDATTFVRGRVLINYGATDMPVYVADAVRSGAQGVLDTGAVSIPPRGLAAGNNAGTKFRLSMQKAGGDTLTVHSVHFMPSGSGLFRRLRMVDTAVILDATDGIVDDGPEGIQYVFDTSPATYPLIKGYGQPVHLWPNRINLLRVLVSASPWAAAIAWTAQGWYRPRRLSL